MPEYQLYGRLQTGVMAVQALMAEGGIAHVYHDVPRPRTLAETEALARINPRLQVPVLIHPDGTVITEGPAILSHLADAHPALRLIPAPGSTARARHDRWTAFFHANVYEAMLRELAPARYTDDPDGVDKIASSATAYVRRHFQLFEAELGDGPYLTGAGMQVFDLYLWMLCYWIDAQWLAAHCPRIDRLWKTAAERPALARIAREHFG